MADHLRTQVREAVVALVTGLATTGSRVTQHSDDPLDAAVASSINVRVGPESIEQTAWDGSYVELRRAMTVTITPRARATTAAGVLDLLDQMAKEVEEATLRQPAVLLSGLALMLRLVATETSTSGTSGDYVGMLDMQYEIVVGVRDGYPDAVA